jgi:tRNA pseudouridine38/39 synthase
MCFQENIPHTIEEELFNALRKTRLVPEDASWQQLRYSRGGRTDKGVSALGQVKVLRVCL